jgi:Fe-S-cluster-containing dehydrogenase component
MNELAFFIDHSRCIECEACVAACSASEKHCGAVL